MANKDYLICTMANEGWDPHQFIARRSVAFTLAEVLITLAFIGVVAALTIPTLINNYQKHQTASALKKAYSTLSQAVQLSVIENGTAWIIGTNSAANAAEFNEKYLIPYLKVAKNCGTDHNGDCYFEAYYLSETTKIDWITSKGSTFFLDDGIKIMTTVNGSLAIFYIDVNGSKKPNVIGKDIFEFDIALYKAGITPRYFNRTIEEYTSDTEKMCNKNQTGEACAALIMKNGWTIPDNYPW